MGAIGQYITKRNLSRLNGRHIGHFPQVACFAFDLITTDIHLNGRYERAELELLAQEIFPKLPSRRLCLDIGANIGNHSLAFAEHFDHVIAFEPHPRTYKLLSCNADLVTNLTPLNIGASDKAGEIETIFDPGNLGATTVEKYNQVEKSDKERRVTFRLERLDDLPEFKSVGPVDFVKIDVERHEVECLKGAEVMLRRDHPLIAIEILSDGIENGKTPALELLKTYGYAYTYQLKETRRFASLPKPLAKLMRVIFGLVTNMQSTRSYEVAPIDLLEHRDYGMILVSATPLASG